MERDSAKQNFTMLIFILQISAITGALRNVGLGKITSQVHLWSHPSRLAVDGNTDRHMWRGHSCSHTLLVTNPWWEVDLGELFVIEYLKIHNRKDCCWDRLTDVLFQVSTDHTKYELFYYRPGTMGQIEEIYPNGRKIGRWVKVSMSKSAILTLCEVEVMSDKKVKDSNVFMVTGSQRGTGKLIQSRLSATLIRCASLCFADDNCYSANLVKDPRFAPYKECFMMNSLKNGSIADSSSTFIWLESVPIE